MTQDAMRVAFEREVERLQINYVTDGDYVALYAFFQAAHQSREAEVQGLREVLVGLRYSHGCWCDIPPLHGNPHARACAAATKALTPAKEE